MMYVRWMMMVMLMLCNVDNCGDDVLYGCKSERLFSYIN